MRQIKFRAWDYKHEVMYDPENMGIKPLTDRTSELTISSEGIFIRPDNEMVELMQFTGLYDINKKEIYEGDIVFVKINWRSINKEVESYEAVIEWDEMFPSFAMKKLHNNEAELDFDKYGLMSIEVIGNKFENPELLKL